MSNLPTTTNNQTPQTDFSQKEVDQLRSFNDNGRPGVSTVGDESLRAMFDMYMNGASYSQVAEKFKVKKAIVLFFADKQQWYEKKLEHFNSVLNDVQKQIAIANVENRSFLTDLMRAFRLYYRDSIDNFLLTKDPKVFESIDFNHLKHLYKCAELLEKLEKTNDPDKPASTNLIFPNGATLTKIDERTLSISGPKQEASAPNPADVSAVLKFLADISKNK